jgi:uncharacterized RDD family membrane protein YckC
MTPDEESVTRILSILSHPIRRGILSDLNKKGECSFTDLMNSQHLDTGKLSFHIRSLAPFLEQTPANKYRLSKVGEHAVRVINDLETWAIEVDIAEKIDKLRLASFKKRAIAFLIDLLMILAVAIVILIPNALSLIIATLLGNSVPSPTVDINQMILLTLILLWGYSTLLEGFAGQTLGKGIVGLKAIRVDGNRLSYEHAAVRCFGKAILPFLPFDLLIGRRINDKRFMRYFDKFAGTTVVDLRPHTQVTELALAILNIVVGTVDLTIIALIAYHAIMVNVFRGNSVVAALMEGILVLQDIVLFVLAYGFLRGKRRAWTLGLIFGTLDIIMGLILLPTGILGILSRIFGKLDITQGTILSAAGIIRIIYGAIVIYFLTSPRMKVFFKALNQTQNTGTSGSD